MKRVLSLALSLALLSWAVSGAAAAAEADESAPMIITEAAADTAYAVYPETPIVRDAADLLRQDTAALASTDDLPAQFDLRTEGRLPLNPARTQEDEGDSWAFAAAASAESAVIQETGQPAAFSEQHMLQSLYHQAGDSWTFDITTGGTRGMAAAYFARGSGPVQRTDGTADTGGGTEQQAVQLGAAKYLSADIGCYMVQDGKEYISTLCGDIKQALMEHGAVSTAYYAYDPSKLGLNPYYNARTQAYYYDGTVETPNAYVTIVGWDDTFAADNFAVGHQPGLTDGAWIVRASQGEEFGSSGYFYISYADKNIGKYATVLYDAQDAYDNIQSHVVDTTIIPNIFQFLCRSAALLQKNLGQAYGGQQQVGQPGGQAEGNGAAADCQQDIRRPSPGRRAAFGRRLRAEGGLFYCADIVVDDVLCLCHNIVPDRKRPVHRIRL